MCLTEFDSGECVASMSGHSGKCKVEDLSQTMQAFTATFYSDEKFNKPIKSDAKPFQAREIVLEIGVERAKTCNRQPVITRGRRD